MHPRPRYGPVWTLDATIIAHGVGFLRVDLILRRAGGKAGHDADTGDGIQRHIETSDQTTG